MGDTLLIRLFVKGESKELARQRNGSSRLAGTKSEKLPTGSFAIFGLVSTP